MTESIAFSCQDIVELVTEYLDGGLAAGERLAFERHVGLCPPCRGHFAQLRRVIDVAPVLRDDELSPSLRAGLEAAFADWKRDGRR